jgi:hypothetical protein
MQDRSGGAGSLIRPMPLRAAPPPPQPSASSAASSSYDMHSRPSPSQHTAASYPQQRLLPRKRQLSELDEDEEDYWGGEEEDGLEEALVGLEAGVVSCHRSGGSGGSVGAFRLALALEVTFLTFPSWTTQDVRKLLNPLTVLFGPLSRTRLNLVPRRNSSSSKNPKSPTLRTSTRSRPRGLASSVRNLSRSKLRGRVRVWVMDLQEEVERAEP